MFLTNFLAISVCFGTFICAKRLNFFSLSRGFVTKLTNTLHRTRRIILITFMWRDIPS